MMKFKKLFRKYSRKNALLAALFLIGFIYVILPGPVSISEFLPLPYSTKSTQEGDTFQNPNIAAYYSNFRRAFITFFYKLDFEKKLIPGLPIPVVTLNHPPEYAYTYVRDQQESTFLEEYTRPLRESIFVNGYEPLIENYIRRRQADFIGNNVIYRGGFYATKTTLRYYPSSPVFRTLVYIGIWASAVMLFKIFIKAQRTY